AQGSALGSDGNPRIIADQDIFDRDDQDIAALGAFQPNGTADGIRQRRNLIEPRSQTRDGLVLFRLEVASTRVVGFNFKALAAVDAQERVVCAIEGVLSALFAGDSLHHAPRPRLIARKITPPMTASIRSNGMRTKRIAGIRLDLPVLPLYL